MPTSAPPYGHHPRPSLCGSTPPPLTPIHLSPPPGASPAVLHRQGSRQMFTTQKCSSPSPARYEAGRPHGQWPRQRMKTTALLPSPAHGRGVGGEGIRPGGPYFQSRGGRGVRAARLPSSVHRLPSNRANPPSHLRPPLHHTQPNAAIPPIPRSPATGSPHDDHVRTAPHARNLSARRTPRGPFPLSTFRSPLFVWSPHDLLTFSRARGPRHRRHVPRGNRREGLWCGNRRPRRPRLQAVWAGSTSSRPPLPAGSCRCRCVRARLRLRRSPGGHGRRAGGRSRP